MRIKYNNKNDTLTEYIYKKLDGADYGIGAIEELEATVRNIRTMLSVLVNKLADEDKIDLDDIKEMLEHRMYEGNISFERGN